MTPDQKELVQSSFAKVEPIADTAATLFYDRLFTIAPEVRPFFSEDISEQKMKLMQTLAFAVRNLDRLDEVVPAVQALARRHVSYKVEAGHYATVGEALLWTLEQGLGDEFTPEVKDAWTAVYGLLSNTMIEAAYS